MSDVQAYTAALVVEQPSEITINDGDEDGDLETYTDIKIFFQPPFGKPIEWSVQSVTPIYTDEIDPKTGQPIKVVNTVILTVIPKASPLGCLGLFLPRFLMFHKGRPTDDPPSSGGLTGSMGQGGKFKGIADAKTKTFTLKSVSLYYGLPA